VWAVAESDAVLKVAHADHDLARARMRREAEALAAIGPPAAPRLDGHGELSDGRAWLAMERVGGATLAEVLAVGRTPLPRILAIARGLADSLARVHAAGFVHRDIKPDNLVQRADGSVAILDLGLARRWPHDSSDPTRQGVQVGSLEYIAPEQLLDAATVDPRADLYAFGCVLYELCAGRPPFVGDPGILERAHAALRPPALGSLAEVPAALEALCHECLAKQPTRRPASAAELARRLRELARAPARHLAMASGVAMSMIREGRQPVVLLWAQLPRVDRAMLGLLASRRIAIVSHRGRRVLGGVVGAAHPDPVGVAIAAARDLAQAGARVALHLDSLAVGVAPGGVRLAGAAAEQPEGWLPPGEWTGVVMTRAVASVTAAAVRASELGPGFVHLADGRGPAELFGRDAELELLVADAESVLAGAGPALTVLIGEPGVGKSAFLAELAARLRSRGVAAHFAAMPPPGAGRASHSALTPVIGAPAGTVVRAVGDALRAAARAQPTAILLDDTHLADQELLDALEYATLGGEALPLWVLAAASPRLDQRRPDFGARAERARREVLRPLAEEDAVELTAALLRPAEYPPRGALRQIVGIARGNPMHLVMLTREIHERGAIRARPSGEHFLDTTALDALPPIALGQWLAARELDGIGSELAALARLCAVLGAQVERAEIIAVVDAVERAGGATTTVDVDIGLAELETAGILIGTGGWWAFRHSLLEEGVYETTHADERRALHAAALVYWLGRTARDAGVAARIARHAEAVGARDAAAAAYAVLGRHAHDHHRALEADRAWQGAIRNLDPGTVEHTLALLGRARARYRVQRQREARADLELVLHAARELGDAALEVEALLEIATVLDLSDAFDDSAHYAALARARLAADPAAPTALSIDLDLAEARAVFRRDEHAAAAERFPQVIARALASERWETATIALLLHGPALVALGQLDAAEAAFAQLVALCEARDDRFHLAAALGNRAWLWSARGEFARYEEDVRAVIQLTREGGQAHFERAVTHNLAEDKLWQGAFVEALRLARRSLALQQHGEGSTRIDLLLVARILAASGDDVALRTTLAQLAPAELATEDSLLLRGLHLHAEGGGPDAWAELLAAPALQKQYRIELGLLAARRGALLPQLRGALRELAAGEPVFAHRVAELGDRSELGVDGGVAASSRPEPPVGSAGV
jgi:hypothetical protein